MSKYCTLYWLIWKFETTKWIGKSSYYDGNDDQPYFNKIFLENNPTFVIDCSKQIDTLKIGSLDIRIEFQTKADIPATAACSCLIIHDSLVQYSPL